MSKSKPLVPIIIISLLFLAGDFPVSVYAQTATIKGMVQDSKTGTTLPGANIVISSSEIKTGTASGSSGEFVISNLPPATYTVTISYIGYKKHRISDLILGDGDTKTLEIKLVSTGIQVNPVTVSASRRKEKMLDAPASISVVESSAIESRMALTATEHLKALPSVDIITAGLNQSRVVIRGFNDLFSGSLLSMVDNRITRIPAVRLNAFQLIPTSNLDVERIEVVSGPASALYGPNSANGVMHVLTKSPFDSKGTAVSVGGGERNVLIGTIRHAGVLNNKIGYKFSVQYYKGDDFESIDQAEQNARQDALDAGADPDTLRIGARIFDIESTAFDGRVDFRLTPELSFIVNGGFSRGDNIEITNQGAAQALNASFKYIQGRLLYKNLFAQVFLNKINTGDTYFLRTGQTVINNSSLFVAQAQHNFSIGDTQHFTYGLDLLLTRPDTQGTINGRNEDHDNVDEIGAYLQSETNLSSKFKFIVAARIDDHSRLDGLNFSPRTALVFKPNQAGNLRVTFNKAFSTPTSDNLFSDNLGGTQPTAAIDPLLVPFFGETLTNVRALGTWPTGFNFRFGADGRPMMVSSFGEYLASKGRIPTANTYIPADVNTVWPAMRDLIIAGTPAAQRNLIANILPKELSETVPGILGVLNTETQQFDPIDPTFVRDIRSVAESSTTTFELGYKGLLSHKFLASVDVYHSRIKDFVGPLRTETPSVFVDVDALETVLINDIVANTILTPQLAKDLVTQFTRNPEFATLPIGIISPVEVQNGTDIILTYRNVGDVSVTGLDLSLTYFLNKNWNITGNYSYIDKDYFESKDGRSDIALNAPKNKIGAIINYRNDEAGFDGNLRFRFIDGFPVNSGIFVGEVERYTVVDLNTSYQLPFSDNTKLTLTIQNLMNNKHREFVGLPEIGRLAWMRITQSL
ncbi:MAG: TonB-dependent receptor domain-containing protein [bacterium]